MPYLDGQFQRTRRKLEHSEVAAHLQGFNPLKARSQIVLAHARMFGNMSTAFTNLEDLLKLRQEKGMETPPYQFLSALDNAMSESDLAVPSDPHRYTTYHFARFYTGRVTRIEIARWYGCGSEKKEQYNIVCPLLL